MVWRLPFPVTTNFMEMGSPMLTSVIEATVASLKDPTPPVKLIGALLGSDFTLMLTVFVEISLATVRVKKEGNPKPLASSSRRRPTVAGRCETSQA